MRGGQLIPVFSLFDNLFNLFILFYLKLSVRKCKTVGSHRLIAGTNIQTYTRVIIARYIQFC